MRQQFNDAMKEAMKSGDKARLSTIRLIIAAIKDRDIQARGDGAETATDDQLLQLLQKMAKQRADSIEAFTVAGRTDLVDKEAAEKAVIESFLPQQMGAEETRAAIAAAIAAEGQPGLLGLHLEGPHFDPRRKGTHDPALIRPMTDDDLATLTRAAQALPHLICTVAPEAVTTAQIAALAQAGATVSLGHSDCSFEQARAGFDAGATMATHLFNAMSPLTHRAPGLTGAALDDGRVWAGLIADGFHVDAAALRIALRGKAGPGRMFLVSDAMSTIGTDLPGFLLNGRQIFRKDGRLTLADGTLAGADIAQIDGLRHLHLTLGLPLADALQLAALFPAQAVGAADIGHLQPGARADFVALTPAITAAATWIGGQQVTG